MAEHADHLYRSSTPAATRAPVREALPCDLCPAYRQVICARLAPEELTRLANIQSIVRYDRNQQIFQQDDPVESLYNVLSGVVRAHRSLPDGRRQITGFLYAGDFVGLAHDHGYAYSTEAVIPLTLCRYPATAFLDLCSEMPRLESSLLRVAAHELSRAQERMLVLGKKTAHERLASFLISVADRAEAVGESADILWLPMNRIDLGDYLGLAMETASRTLSAFARKGLIKEVSPHHVRLLDRDALSAIAEPAYALCLNELGRCASEDGGLMQRDGHRGV